jgi:hypothetical protein
MDDDYIMFLAPDSDAAGARAAPAAARRAAAMEQWNAMRADEEYRAARSAIVRLPETSTWRRFADRNRRALVRTVHITQGECIAAEGPLVRGAADVAAAIAAGGLTLDGPGAPPRPEGRLPATAAHPRARRPGPRSPRRGPPGERPAVLPSFCVAARATAVGLWAGPPGVAQNERRGTAGRMARSPSSSSGSPTRHRRAARTG